jgi:hypothetical protein
MKSSQAVPRRKHVANGSHRSVEKSTTAAVPCPNEEAGQPEGPVWGHWFNTEGMQINNQGSPTKLEGLAMQ